MPVHDKEVVAEEFLGRAIGQELLVRFGIVCVGTLKTLRQKTHIVGLIYDDGLLHTTDVMKSVTYGEAQPKTIESTVCEMTVVADEKTSKMALEKAVKNAFKKFSNSLEIVSRSIMSAVKDDSVSTISCDVTSVPVKLRGMVYNKAKTKATTTRNVVIPPAISRFKMINKIELDKFSYTPGRDRPQDRDLEALEHDGVNCLPATSLQSIWQVVFDL